MSEEMTSVSVDQNIIAKPVGSKIVVARIDAPTVTKGGIHLPDTSAEKSNHGVIVALDESWEPERPRRKLKVNDRIAWGAYYGVEININDEQLFVLDQSDVMVVLEEAPTTGLTTGPTRSNL